MKKLIILLMFPSFLIAQDRFISPTGNNTNDGLTEGNAWSLEHAVTQDIYPYKFVMKDGDYGNKQVTIAVPNTKIVGYDVTPGDISTTNGSSYTYPNAINASSMPTITGTNPAQGTAFTVTAAGVLLENIQIQNMNRGVLAQGAKVHLKNVVCHTMGTTTNTGNEFDFYDGLAIEIQRNDALVENCVVVNAASEGIKIVDANDGIIRYSKVYSDIPTAQDGTDYYIQILRGNNNLIEYCHVEKDANDSEVGRHGFVVKWSGINNIIRNNTAKRLNLEASFVGVSQNYFANNTVDGDFDASGDLAARARIANGAHHNRFIGNRYIDCYSGPSFADWDDGATNDNSLEIGAGNDNYSINEVFVNVEHVVFFDSFENLQPAVNNYLINPTIVDCNYLIRRQSDNQGTKIINALIHNTPNFAWNTTAGIDLNTQFENIVLSNSFPASDLTPFLESDIQENAVAFADAANGDYTPTTGVLNTGQNASSIVQEAKRDVNNLLRSHYTLGAFNQGVFLKDFDWSNFGTNNFLIN